MKRTLKKISLGIIFVAIMSSTFLGIINSEAIAPGGGTILCMGYVRSSVTGAAISGATVRLMELETGVSNTVTTSSSGFYKVSISVSSYMSFILTASKSGYYSKSKTYYSTGSYSYNFNLNPKTTYYTVTCHGYVKDFNSDLGIGSASVTLRETKTGTTKTVSTSYSGYYYVSITTTSYTSWSLTASKSGYEAQSKSYTSKGTYRADFALKPPGYDYIFRCWGYVKDYYTNSRVSGATVKVTEAQTSISKTVTVDTNGYYYLAIATPSYSGYDVEASASNYYFSQTVAYQNPSSYSHDFYLDRYDDQSIEIITVGADNGNSHYVMQDTSVQIVAIISGTFAKAYLKIDNSAPILMTRNAETDRYYGYWNTAGFSLDYHTITVYVGDSYGNIFASQDKEADILDHYLAHLYFEIDYMVGCRPSQNVLDYWVNYWNSRAIEVTYRLDDEISYSSSISLDDYWDLENSKNDFEFDGNAEDDRASGDIDNAVFDSKEKWILFGSKIEDGLLGFCHTLKYPLLPGMLPELWCGNYMFIAVDECKDTANDYQVSNDNVITVALMHEAAHSIGVGICYSDGDENYDSDPYSIMSTGSTESFSMVNHWYYTEEYWHTKNTAYYYEP